MLNATLYYIQRLGISIYLFVLLSAINTFKISFAYFIIMFNMPSNAWNLSDDFFEYEDDTVEEEN